VIKKKHIFERLSNQLSSYKIARDNKLQKMLKHHEKKLKNPEIPFDLNSLFSTPTNFPWVSWFYPDNLTLCSVVALGFGGGGLCKYLGGPFPTWSTQKSSRHFHAKMLWQRRFVCISILTGASV